MTAAVLPLPAWRRPGELPRIARVGVCLFLWLLPFHSLGIALLFGVVGLDSGTTRAIAAWKEIAVIGLFVWVLLRALLGQGPKTRICAADVAVSSMLGLALLFGFSANAIFRADLPSGAQLYGFRDAVMFMLLYYVGRGTPELADSEPLLKTAFFVALVVSVIGILERIFVSPDMLVLLGVAAYMNDFLGMSEFTAGNEWGLPQNYWSHLGGVAIRRSGSVFLHSQGFALPYLLLLPAASAWTLNRVRTRSFWVKLGYAAIWLGLLLTITRMTIIVCFLQVGLLYLMYRRPEWALGSVVAALAIFAVGLAVVPGLAEFVWETLTWQSGSSESHLKDWEKGINAFIAQPWGHGLGTSDQTAVRFLLHPVSADNMFLMYATQLGLLGLIALAAILGTQLAASWRLFRTAAEENRRRFGAVMSLTTLGLFINGATSVLFSSMLLAYLYFWFAGASVTASQAAAARRPTSRA